MDLSRFEKPPPSTPIERWTILIRGVLTPVYMKHLYATARFDAIQAYCGAIRRRDEKAGLYGTPPAKRLRTVPLGHQSSDVPSDQDWLDLLLL